MFLYNPQGQLQIKYMSQETELKLSVPQDQIAQLKSHPFWQEHGAKPPETLHLGNTYFDTPDLRLNQAKVALRIREVNGHCIQTLKTQGVSVNGLTRRGEWEWSLDANELNGQALAPVWPDELSDVAVASLGPLFTTDFHRTRWLLAWQKPYAKVEVALDEGVVRSGDLSTPVCELELELLEGCEEALTVIARALQSYIDVSPSDQSKAERGYQLVCR